ncbi:hypothetical protein [Massilia aerilata]|uniref:Uncharacterized protein n=1 Tax=Massilia aerilata TaxID=453817 RepID=A0ABW0RXK9_9BURK
MTNVKVGAMEWVNLVGVVEELFNHNYFQTMPTTNLTIAAEPVLDFECAGWPIEKRQDLFQAVQGIQGVTGVGGAGHSTMRVRYDPSSTSISALTLAVDQAADTILPGHNFSG